MGRVSLQLVRHSIDKYGQREVESWIRSLERAYISYWHGTPEEYDKLYDYTAAAVKRALPTLAWAALGPLARPSPKAAAFLNSFSSIVSKAAPR